MKRWPTVLTALAAGHGKPQDKPGSAAAMGKVKFECEATVITSAGQSLEVTVTAGSKTVKAYRGKRVAVRVDPKAKLINATVDPSVPLTLNQLVIGAKVHLGGTIDKKTEPDTFTATKVILQKLPKAP